MFNIFNRISSQEKVEFAKNLAVMLKSGITIDEALTSLSGQTNSRLFRDIINNVNKEIGMGTSLSEAFSKEENIFGSVFVNLIRAGEASGTLEENLVFLSDWLERNNDLREEIRAATLYPKFLVVSVILLAGGLASSILPKLVPLFRQMRVELPLATRILLTISVFLEKYWISLLLVFIALIAIFMFIRRIKIVKYFFDWFYVNLPVLGKFVIEYQLALISQLFSTLFKSGISMQQSLEIISEAATNLKYKRSLKKIRERVDKGITLSEAMSYYPELFPNNLISIIDTSEKSGTIDNAFLYLSEFYIKEVKNNTKRLPTIIEPVLLVLIAIVVAFIAFSIIMPIYRLSQGISR